jgi:hypothetical protein
MAILAEQIVEEWITRQGYFTIRRLKIGIEEIDLLAIKYSENGQWDKIHIEVQVSVRPGSYISGLTKERQKEFNISGSGNATKLTDEQLKLTVDDWLYKKYFQDIKKQVRKRLSNSDDWKYLFVHGIVKSEKELEFIKMQNIETKNIKEILNDLQNNNFDFTTGSATDIIELIGLAK